MPEGLGEPPDIRGLDPMMLNERELREIHQKLADWVDEAEEADDTDRPHEQLIDDVRNALSSVSEERAHRRTM
ncbi:MAG: hypothetical protein OTJ98_06190 [Dehalococcoidia bacterium]|nr:hypothetical protein [Dehalococcoidia bacterium]